MCLITTVTSSSWHHWSRTCPLLQKGIVGKISGLNHLTKSYLVLHEQGNASPNLSWSSSWSKEQSHAWHNPQIRALQVSQCILGGEAMQGELSRYWPSCVISPGYLPDCRPRTVGSHTSNLCIIISKEGFCTYIVTFISNLNPTLLRYFSLLSTSSVFSAASLSSVPLCYICSGVTKCLPWHSLSFSSFSQNFTNSRWMQRSTFESLHHSWKHKFGNW
jgi:hypothetical protein